MQELEPEDLGWCPFCGSKLEARAKTKEIFCEGRNLKIHKDELREFQETGLLKYLEGPRSGPFSQDAIDLGILFGVAAAIGIFLLWTIMRIGA